MILFPLHKKDDFDITQPTYIYFPEEVGIHVNIYTTNKLLSSDLEKEYLHFDDPFRSFAEPYVVLPGCVFCGFICYKETNKLINYAITYSVFRLVGAKTNCSVTCSSLLQLSHHRYISGILRCIFWCLKTSSKNR